MKSRRWHLAVIVALGLINPAAAGIGIFSRKPKVDPAEQVPTLIMQLKTDKDDNKRANAAADLRGYDPRTHPEIMTVLIDALTKDTSPAVRSEAAATIAKLRPISQQAGFALDQAAANDPAIRVRMAARQALWQYNLVGYRSGKPNQANDEPKTVKGPALTPPATNQAPLQRITKRNPRTGQLETAEPPLADAVESEVTTLKPITPTHPVNPPKLLTPPPAHTSKKKSAEPEGPSLTPPQ
jgi:hypothetical protein